MRLTKENIHKYLDIDGDLILRDNQEITHIDYLPDDIKYIDMAFSKVEEITCELHEGLIRFYCEFSRLKSLPLIPKSLEYFDGRHSNLPKEYKVFSLDENNQCNDLRKLPLLPKTLIYFDSEYTNLPKEYQAYIFDDNVKCNNLRKLQMINSL